MNHRKVIAQRNLLLDVARARKQMAGVLLYHESRPRSLWDIKTATTQPVAILHTHTSPGISRKAILRLGPGYSCGACYRVRSLSSSPGCGILACPPPRPFIVNHKCQYSGNIRISHPTLQSIMHILLYVGFYIA